MRKAAVVLAILIVLVLAGLVITPQFIDLDRFRGPIAAQLAERTGLPVELQGPIELALLPTPTLTAGAVRIANPPGTAVPDMVRLRALEVKPALLPLLAGRLELVSATLVEPEIDLERLADGRWNWRGAAPASPQGAAAPFDRLSIQNGAVTWRFAGGAERFEHITAAATVDDASGEIGASGSLVARGAELRFDLDSGAPGAATVPVQLTVTTRPAARLQLDGELSGPADDLGIAGTLTFTGPDARAIFATLAQASLPAALAQKLAVEAKLGGTLARPTLEHLAVDLGPAHAEGALHVEPGTPPKIALTLRVPQLDLDRWPVAQSPAASAPGQGSLAGGVATLAGEAPIEGRATPNRAGLPTAFAASLDLGIDAIGWRGGLIRQARLELSLAHGTLTLGQLAAELPGASEVSLSGGAELTPDGPRAEGKVEIGADDLRSLLGWLGVRFATVPADRLRRASFSGRLALAGDRLDLTDATATLDATRFSGAATVLLRARPGLGLRLVADQLNLDAYLPPGAARGAPDLPSGVASGLGDFDANIDARIGALTWRGQPLSGLHLSATLQNGDATLHELKIGDLGGATATLSGVVEALSGTPTGQLAFDMRGPQLERVLRILAPRLAGRRIYGAFSLGGGMQYDRDRLTIDTDLQLLDGHAHVVGDIARASGALDLGFDLDHPSFARLVQSFSPLYQPPGDPGPVKLSGRIAGDRHKFTLQPLALAIGQSTLAGTVGVDLSGAKPKLAADLTAGDWAIDRFVPQRQTALSGAGSLPPGLMPVEARMPPTSTAAPASPAVWSEAPIKLGLLRRADVDLKLAAHSLAYGGWKLDGATVSAALADGVLSLKQVTGDSLGGTVAATGTIDARAVPAVKTQLVLRDAQFKSLLAGAGFLDGRFDLDASLDAVGDSTATMIAHASGTATLASASGSFGGIDLKAVDAALAAHPGNLLALLRGGGRTPFSKLAGSFQIADGIARSDDLRLVAEGGEGAATAQLDLPHWQMASRVELRLAATPAPPPLVMRLDGPIDAPRVVFDINDFEHYLARAAGGSKPARP